MTSYVLQIVVAIDNNMMPSLCTIVLFANIVSTVHMKPELATEAPLLSSPGIETTMAATHHEDNHFQPEGANKVQGRYLMSDLI